MTGCDKELYMDPESGRQTKRNAGPTTGVYVPATTKRPELAHPLDTCLQTSSPHFQ